jgi:hypothetical protein
MFSTPAARGLYPKLFALTQIPLGKPVHYKIEVGSGSILLIEKGPIYGHENPELLFATKESSQPL